MCRAAVSLANQHTPMLVWHTIPLVRGRSTVLSLCSVFGLPSLYLSLQVAAAPFACSVGHKLVFASE
jgi:hypothetical protein